MSFYHDITKMSGKSLLAQHKCIADRLAEEDAQPPNTPKQYGVRQFPDWKQQSDEIEKELDRRTIQHAKTIW